MATLGLGLNLDHIDNIHWVYAWSDDRRLLGRQAWQKKVYSDGDNCIADLWLCISPKLK